MNFFEHGRTTRFFATAAVRFFCSVYDIDMAAIPTKIVEQAVAIEATNAKRAERMNYSELARRAGEGDSFCCAVDHQTVLHGHAVSSMLNTLVARKGDSLPAKNQCPAAVGAAKVQFRQTPVMILCRPNHNDSNEMVFEVAPGGRFE